MNITFSAETEQLLQLFVIVAGVFLIPVAVGLIAVLFKLAFLIHSTSEFVTMASYELTPAIKELRAVVDHLESITERTSKGVKTLGDSFQQAGPMVSSGLQQVKAGTSALLSGIGRSFRRIP